MGKKMAKLKNISCRTAGRSRVQIPATPAIQNTKNIKDRNAMISDPIKPK